MKMLILTTMAILSVVKCESAFSQSKIERTTTPAQAMRWAAQDLINSQAQAEREGRILNPADIRYVWVQDGSVERRATVSFCLNAAVSRTDINYAPAQPFSPIQYVNEHLVRVDLRILCPDLQDRDEIKTHWDAIPNPYFVFSDDGESFGYGPHVSQTDAQILIEFTGARNAIIADGSLHIGALSQIEDGRYYQFSNVIVSTKDGISDFEILLQDQFGVSEETVRRIGADQYVGMTNSRVTAKPRRIAFFTRPAPSGKVQGWVAITYDTFDGNAEEDAHPLLSLLEFQHDGTEAIIEKNNGHLLYLLYDGEGNLVEEAPPNLVSDSTVPKPHTSRLQPAISCIRCHGQDKMQGWQPFRNDIRRLVNLQGLDILADQTADAQGLTRDESMRLLARLYSNDMQKPLRRARADQTDAILKATLGAVDEEGMPWDYADVSKSLDQMFRQFYYDPIGPIEACRDLGYQVKETDQAKRLFRILMRTYTPSGFIMPEDFRIASIAAGTAIPRRDWNKVLIDAYTRARINESLMKKDETK